MTNFHYQSDMFIRAFIKERFITFDILPRSGAEDFFHLILKNLKNIHVEIDNCRGQAYDGASTMSGEINGVQSKIKEIVPQALFVHCSAHKLNLILSDAVSSCLIANTFFGTIEAIYAFLSSSLPRLHIFNEEAAMLQELERHITLKRLSETRFYSRLYSVKAVIENIAAIYKTIQRILNGEVKLIPSSTAQAAGIWAQMNTFEFYLLLIIWFNILQEVNILSQYFQQKSINIFAAIGLLKISKSKISSMRDEESFKKFEKLAEELSRKWIDVNYTESRLRKKKKFFDEKLADEPIIDSRQKFKVEVFYVIIDTIISQLENRFKDFENKVHYFRALNIENFKSQCEPTEDDLNCIHTLSNFYKNDLKSPENLIVEYKSFRLLYNEFFPTTSDKQLKNEDIINFIISCNLDIIYKNLLTMYQIFLN